MIPLLQTGKTQQITVGTTPDPGAVVSMPPCNTLYIHNDNSSTAFVVVRPDQAEAAAAVAPTDAAPSWAFSVPANTTLRMQAPTKVGLAGIAFYVNAWCPGGAGGAVRFTPFN